MSQVNISSLSKKITVGIIYCSAFKELFKKSVKEIERAK